MRKSHGRLVCIICINKKIYQILYFLWTCTFYFIKRESQLPWWVNQEIVQIPQPKLPHFTGSCASSQKKNEKEKKIILSMLSTLLGQYSTCGRIDKSHDKHNLNYNHKSIRFIVLSMPLSVIHIVSCTILLIMVDIKLISQFNPLKTLKFGYNMHFP